MEKYCLFWTVLIENYKNLSPQSPQRTQRIDIINTNQSKLDSKLAPSILHFCVQRFGSCFLLNFHAAFLCVLCGEKVLKGE